MTPVLSNLNSVAATVAFVPGTQPENRYATSQAQLEVWLSAKQSEQANCAYNEISTLELRGPLDVDRLKQAIVKVCERHGSLRSTVGIDGQHILVHPRPQHAFSFVDWSIDPSKDIAAARRMVVQNEATTPFDLVDGPLLRAVLQKATDTQHWLTLTAHHLVMDGWSLALFYRDLGYFYDTLSGIQRDALAPASQYDEYALQMDQYMASDAGQADEAFWTKCYQGDIPVLELPIEKPRPSLRTFTAERMETTLPATLVAAVQKVGAKSGCSRYNTLLAAFTAYVAQISGCDDFGIGIPTAGQAALDHPELIGHCVNTMPLRTQVDSDTSFLSHMKQTRSRLLDAFEHQRYSYGTLLRKLAPARDPSRPPMLNVSFNIDPVMDTAQLGFTGFDLDITIEPRRFENFEWFINGVIRKDQSIELQVQYNSDLYTERAMECYFDGFRTFLEGVAASPDTRINDLPKVSLRMRQQAIVDWNATALDYPIEATLHSEFSRQATATPDAVCVRFGDQTLTYADVDSQSNRIARYLKSEGVQEGDLVGICVNRSEQMLVNLIAILKAGCGYVPLDPAYPSDRLQYMCDHSQLTTIVTERSLVPRITSFNKPHLAIDDAREAIANLDDSDVQTSANPNDTCYVIYTSGSTGKPKGVQVQHGAVVNFLYAMREAPGFTQDDSILAVTTLSFDIAVLELYLPIVFGGSVVIADTDTSSNGSKLADALEKHDITWLQATPATWRLLIQSGWQGKTKRNGQAFKVQAFKVLCGGEPMPNDLVDPLLKRCDQLWNMYGPTETTVWSAVYRITDASSPILIGKPIGNTQIYLLDQQGHEVSPGCEGEVYIGGAGVTQGYLHRPDLTEERFVDNRYRNPFVAYNNNKLYRTGDLARYTFDGNLQFLRRNDKQVKVRGYRIELGEIESHLKSHPAVAQCVVIVREDSPGDAKLVAYVIPKPEQSASAIELREHLRMSVPNYMVPQNFVTLDSMPQTNNGKIDYASLPSPKQNTASDDLLNATAEKPETEAEKRLAAIWQEVLETDQIGRDDNFFDIGGHSLLVMKVIAIVAETTSISLSPQDFLTGTLRHMAYQLEDVTGAADTTADASVKVGMETVDPAKPSSSAEPKHRLLRSLKGFWNE
ncbi:Linear gramicidin synthase subunit D [Roseimaritima multifibrata]|uniref:Linear gramicidin synthase subunit D n=1 Tax=Roseimaritima multifibrata TaxID=1930274 RepID=A0A517MMQ4_9BACT|nr:non-ribosomal peptide synthetase [Roseimaritima multifibrata]QDS96168.1 Linear gramicidin synthase subunit D [Roseimaritima multifibrata]